MSLRAKTYCSTNLLTQEVSQHIALFDAQLHGTLRDSSLRAPVQGDRRERCEDRFPKILSGLSEPVQLFLLPAGCGDAFDELFLEYDVQDDHRNDRDD